MNINGSRSKDILVEIALHGPIHPYGLHKQMEPLGYGGDKSSTYQTAESLVKRGLLRYGKLTIVDGKARRPLSLTAAGRAHLKAEAGKVSRIVAAAEAVSR